MWLTGYDVADQFESNRETAPDQQAGRALLQALYDVFANRKFRPGEVQRIYDKLAHDKQMRGVLMLQDPAAAAKAAETARERAIMSETKSNNLTAPQKAQATQAGQAAREQAEVDNLRVYLFDALKDQFKSKPVTAERFGRWTQKVDNTHIGGLRLTRSTDTDGHPEIVIIRAGAHP
jgi:hypothetical protein